MQYGGRFEHVDLKAAPKQRGMAIMPGRQCDQLIWFGPVINKPKSALLALLRANPFTLNRLDKTMVETEEAQSVAYAIHCESKKFWCDSLKMALINKRKSNYKKSPRLRSAAVET